LHGAALIGQGAVEEAIAPMAPAAPVTRIGLSCVDFIIMSLV
jgi:hypothetical protein